MDREVAYYLTVSGDCPTKSFMESLPGKAAKKVAWVIDLLEDLDRVPEMYFSKMAGTDEIWECRTTFGSNAYRVLAFIDGHKILLAQGFKKKAQKTPLAEIERAERYRRDYFQRKREKGL